jgi:Holliday junction resolvasome RuvABC endonuclease subunit
MRILALDISTKSTGWFVTKRSCGIIVPDPEASFEEKLVVFRVELDFLLMKHCPDLVVIEDAYYQPRKGSIHTLKTLVKFAGVAQELCASKGIRTEIITATTARKYCCGRSGEKVTKEDVFDFFVEKYGLNTWTFKSHNDITDAMALSWGYREKKRLEKKNNKKKAGK